VQDAADYRTSDALPALPQMHAPSGGEIDMGVGVGVGVRGRIYAPSGGLGRRFLSGGGGPEARMHGGLRLPCKGHRQEVLHDAWELTLCYCLHEYVTQ